MAASIEGDVARLHARGMGSRRIAAELGVGRGRVRRALERLAPGGAQVAGRGHERPGVELAGDTATVTLPEGASLGDVADLLRRHGLDAAEWHVERVTANEWEALAAGGETVTLRQVKAIVRSTRGMVAPAAEVAERYTPPVGDAGEPLERLVVVCGDHQSPYHDPALHAVALRWLADVAPDEGVHLGDLLDFPTISRHRDRLRWSASVQECVDAGYGVLSDYRDASPRTRWALMRGNHDWRIESEVMDRAERVAFVRPAQVPDGPAEAHLYSLGRLLHLDALGVELVGLEGEDWRYGEHVLAPGVVVRHEPPALTKAARLNRTILAGHTHRQRLTAVTTYDEDDRPVVRTIAEVGTMARTPEGLGYAERPDWQAGFATVAIDADGTHHIDLATWRGGVLTWRGERWRA